tara:strand:- start:409 stop:585 length:177 start_codon:yes stop_codon:yes gene_type:complete
MSKQELIDEVYNQVIQEYSHLADEYEGDELQDKIMEIVDREIKDITNSKKINNGNKNI